MKTSSLTITPLEAWIREKIRFGRETAGESFLEALKSYQLQRINAVIDYARCNSSFYRRHLASIPATPLKALSGISRIPFTTPSDLTENPLRFLAVSQDDIARIVTLRTSGSTGDSKRLFFTEEDLELTVDFFHRGMSTLVQPGWKTAILLPGERPDSVGDLLRQGLRRMDIHALAYGPVADPDHAAEAIASFGAHCLVGIPTQVLAVARSRAGAAIGKGAIESVLLSTDYVSRAIEETLEEVWGCRVFGHYGMTEMGLGGGVECDALNGYHLREADLYFEIIDPETGEACPDGTTGEVVFTTLTRRGMPLIRYRTGDIARMITGSCPCGTVLKRMGRVRGRRDGALRLGPGRILTLPDMDDALFGLPGLLDYRVRVSQGMNKRFRMHIDIHGSQAGGPADGEILRALNKVDAIRKSIEEAKLDTPTLRFSPEGRWTTTGASKRKIIVMHDPLD